MNGVKLTNDNSQLVYASPTHITRVLNSLFDRSFMKPVPGQHSGVTGVAVSTPVRTTLATNALENAQANAKAAADNITKAKAGVSSAQTRLNNAKAATVAKEKEVDIIQQSIDAFPTFAANFPPQDKILYNPLNLTREQLIEGMRTGLPLTLANLNNELAKAKSEVTAAQNALDAANKAVSTATANKQKADQAVASAAEMKDAITATTAFFQVISEKFGDRAARLSQELAAQARSAKIRSVPEAIALFEKHAGTALRKLNTADKIAIANAFKSLDQAAVARQLSAYAKVFGRFNKAVDVADLLTAVKKALDTGDLKDLFNKLESMALTSVAGSLVAMAFAVAGAPLGIIGYGIVLTLVGVFFSNEEVLKAINISLGM